MIKVNIPKGQAKERRYIINVLLSEFLGIDYEISESNKSEDITFQLENNKKIIFKDYFFSKLSTKNYSVDLIPQKIEHLESNKYCSIKNIPIVYGKNMIEDDNPNTIICHVDIFSSAFFMLTRWEESVLKNKDIHARVLAKDHLSVKFNFFHRPIVNEYLELLWGLLKAQQINQEKKERDYQLYLTHDVDYPLKWVHLGRSIKTLLADLLKRRDLSLFYKNFKCYLSSKLNVKNDPYNNFKQLIDAANSAGVKSYFFFLNGGQSQYDSRHSMNTSFMKSLYDLIHSNNHYIGIHPSYMTQDNYDLLKKEVVGLKKLTPSFHPFGRQHFLRFKVPTTWQNWHDCQLSWSSTMGFSDRIGFRSGVCYAHSTFNIQTRKMLSVKERPLIAMDVSMGVWQNFNNLDTVLNEYSQLVTTVKKYKGDFVFLWHNSYQDQNVCTDSTAVFKRFLNVSL